MKKLFIFILILLSVHSLSCKEISYEAKMSAKEVTDLISKSADDGNEYLQIEQDFINYMIDDISVCEDFSLIYSEETNDINEFGVLLASSDETAPLLYEKIRSYISEMQENQRAFIASYAAEELPKLDDAEVITLGRYVIYSICDRDTRQKTISAVKDALAS